MMTRQTEPAGATGGQGDTVTRRASMSGTIIPASGDVCQDPLAFRLACYHLARWTRAGGASEDRDKAKAQWADLPDDREASLTWLEQRPELWAVVKDIDPEGKPPGAPPLDLLTGYDMLTREWPEPPWAIPDVLPVGLNLLAGKAKLGKSWFALQIAQAVAAGGVILDRQVEPGRVLYLALEDPYRRISERMKKQGWGVEYARNLDIMPLGQFADDVGDLRNGGGEVLARQIEAQGYRLVVIDTLSRAVYGDQNDVQEMTIALSPIQEMAHAHECAAMMVDHHGKLTGGDAIADILGSTAKGAMADCVWGLYRERGKTGAKLSIIGRDVIEQNLALTWDTLTGCWQCEGDADELAMTERRQEILDGLKGTGQASLKEIAEVTGQHKSHTHTRLQDLVTAGLVVRIEKGTRVYYDLPSRM